MLVEINELNQLFLQYFLFANSLFDEHMLQQVEHVRSELKVLNQTSVGGEEEEGEEAEGQSLGFIFKLHLVKYCQCKYLLLREENRSSIHTHLQMKSLKSSDQSSGWWRVGGGFLLKEWKR